MWSSLHLRRDADARSAILEALSGDGEGEGRRQAVKSIHYDIPSSDEASSRADVSVVAAALATLPRLSRLHIVGGGAGLCLWYGTEPRYSLHEELWDRLPDLPNLRSLLQGLDLTTVAGARPLPPLDSLHMRRCHNGFMLAFPSRDLTDGPLVPVLAKSLCFGPTCRHDHFRMDPRSEVSAILLLLGSLGSARSVTIGSALGFDRRAIDRLSLWVRPTFLPAQSH